MCGLCGEDPHHRQRVTHTEAQRYRRRFHFLENEDGSAWLESGL